MDTDALYQLGMLCKEKKNESLAVKYFQAAANKDHAESHIELVEYYLQEIAIMNLTNLNTTNALQI